jgi:glycosyltransferase involved in cell wall biosynthesis
MKIAIDISQIVYGTGVSLYTKNLVTNLMQIDKDDSFILYAGTLRRKQDILNTFPDARVFPIPPTVGDILWNRIHSIPIERLIGKIDLFHTSDWVEPGSYAKKVTTIHDLYPLKFPKLINPKSRNVILRKLSWSFREDAAIIVPSDSTKKDLLDYGVAESKVYVIPEAPTLNRATDESVNKVKIKYGLRGEYLVSIGITRLKNTERIIRSFHLAKPGKDLKLVLVGRPDGVSLRNERNVRILGHVPNEDLAAILTGSKGLLFPSLYEGFGIPILDAFNCGVPVVTSNLSAMQEVAGNAAALVDPYSIESITEGIDKILRGPRSYIDRGYKKVKDFSWNKNAMETLEVYRETLKI